jgi:hypothetical protein
MNKSILPLILILLTLSLNGQGSRTMLEELEQGTNSQQSAVLTATLKSASRLFGEKDDLTTVLTILPSGSVVEVLGSDSTYLNVKYEDTEGYIFRKHATLNEYPGNIRDTESRPPTIAETQAQQEEQQVSRFTYLEQKYGTSIAARLASGKIWKGMNAEMIRDSWGKPQKINRVISGNIIKEEWIFKNTWLYLENDYLTEWGPVRIR